ncbi:MAG: helix-turn-helix domain-containing protein [Candidatus Delongbacteria bacterium]
MKAIIDLHNIIKFHRKKAGLSRNELAELAGVGKTVIFDLEKGKTSVKLSTVEKILEALNIEIKLQSPLMEDYEKSFNQNT